MAKYKISGTTVKYGGEYYYDGDTIDIDKVPDSLKPYLKPVDGVKPEKTDKPDKEK